VAEHDNGYKRLFSHPEMVADLLRGFVREDWVRDLDFSTLERISGSYVTPELRSRESDVVWRVRWERDRWLYEKSRGPEDIQRVLVALIEWLGEPDLAEVRRSFTLWVMRVLLPARVPGTEIPEVTDLQEVKSMLAERVIEWTHQWKQEGLEEGLQKGLEKVRGVLLRDLERRFGPLPEEVRRRVDAIASIEDLTEFSLRAGAAPSLAALAEP
jgi:hypothetical protein